jgi:hypothetical protein
MARRPTRTRIVYRDRPATNYFSLDTIKRIKDWFYVVLPIIAALWLVAGPYVDAKAGEYLKTQLVQIGMDPATVAALNKNLAELQETVKARDEATDKLASDVADLKSLLGTVLELQKLQAIKGDPSQTEPIK